MKVMKRCKSRLIIAVTKIYYNNRLLEQKHLQQKLRRNAWSWRQPNKWRFDSPHDGYLSEMYKIIMALWAWQTKLHTANLYASLIQIISYTYTSMFNIYNYFEKKNCYKFSMSYMYIQFPVKEDILLLVNFNFVLNELSLLGD